MRHSNSDTPSVALGDHPLDNVIWNALATRQAEFAQVLGATRRFVPDIGPLSGFATPDDGNYDALAQLAGDSRIILFEHTPFLPRAGWKKVGGSSLLQMVWQNANQPIPPNPSVSIVQLGAADSAEMLALATLTQPGPFGPRTHELGDFFGIRMNGQLIAMAGERLKVADYTEISAVCTHPEHVGKGYAHILMTAVMRGIFARGETPFLHVRADNERAIKLYEQLGFRQRLAMYFAVLRPDQAILEGDEKDLG